MLKTNKTFMVIGGAGCIGSCLVRYLVDLGYNVKVFDDYSYGSPDNLKFLDKKNKIHGNILQKEELQKAVSNVDGIFHQAALTSVKNAEKQENLYYKVNVQGTKNIFEIAEEQKLKVVFASSASIYGDIKQIPIKENQNKIPNGVYAKTKMLCEKYALEYIKKGVKIIGLRYFNVYGYEQPSNCSGVISNFLNKIKLYQDFMVDGNGLQERDFIHVLDVAKANLLAMKTENTKSNFYNIGSGKSISIIDLAHLILSNSKSHLRIKNNRTTNVGIHLSRADVSLTRKELGWKAQIKLEDWIRKELSQ